MLIYSASIHPKSILNPEGCSSKSTPKGRAAWIAATMPHLDNYPDTLGYTDQGYMDVDAACAAGDFTPANNANTYTEGTTDQQQQQPLPQTQQQQQAGGANTYANYIRNTGNSQHHQAGPSTAGPSAELHLRSAARKASQ